MKKLTLLLVVACGLALSVNAQHNRRVMVEEFTNASCGPCATNNPAFNATLEANADKVTPLKYQVWFPGFDPMYNQNTVDVQDRGAYYSLPFAPDAFINGVEYGVPGGFSATEINDSYGTLTPVTMQLTHTLSADFTSVDISVSVTSDAALAGDLRLRVAVAEKEIIFLSAPGNNGEKEFTDVMRKLLPNAEGTLTGDFTAGQTKTYTFNWSLANFYNLNNVEVVAWLQDDDTKEVWQSAQSLPNTTVVGGNYAKVNLSAAAAYKLTCESTFAPTFNLKNVGTQPLTSADIQYRVDNGTWSTFSWTGNLGANLTTAVALPAVNFTDAGTHKIHIFIANTNNGTQINQVDASGTITVNAFFNASQPPIAEGFEGPAFPPATWALKNTAAGESWDLVSGYGAYGTSDFSAVANFYNIQSGTMEMYLPKLDLTAAAGNTWLLLDHAYVYYVSGADIFKDRMIIEVSANCGAANSWVQVYNKEGDDLATADPLPSSYLPSADEWVTDSIDLSAFHGQEVLVRIKGESHFGNNLFIDNINVANISSGVQNLLSLNGFQVQPNPARSNAEVRFALDQPETLQLQIFGLDGSLVEARQLGALVAGQHVVALDAARLPAGSYRVVLQGKAGIAQTQWIVVK